MKKLQIPGRGKVTLAGETPSNMMRFMKSFAPSKKALAIAGVLMSLAISCWADSVAIDMDAEAKAAAKKKAAASAVAPAAEAKSEKKSTAAKAAAAVEEKEGTIVGVPIARPNGKFLGLSIENGGFKLAFYDAKKHPVAADAARAQLRWNPKRTKGEERVVLLPSGDGKALTFGKFVKGPRVFKVYVTLLAADDTPGEHYVVDYRDDSAESETE